MKSARAAVSALTLSLALAGCDEPKDRSAKTAIAAAAAPLPPLPAWSGELMGKARSDAFPGPLGACLGASDAVAARFGGAPPGVEIRGWSWDSAAKAPVGRVVLADVDGVIVGAGETGVDRPDVKAALPGEVTALTTGWRALTAKMAGPVQTYGVLADGKTLCSLGRLDY